MPNQPPTTPVRLIVSTLVVEDPDMFEIVAEFVAGLDKRAAELAAAHERNAWGELKTLAHQLKGAGGSYGYPELSTLAATMERSIRTHSADEFSIWMRRLSDLVAGARAGLCQQLT
jgi:HPt (histidine-containing phosphotransfer) domain-containing protein